MNESSDDHWHSWMIRLVRILAWAFAIYILFFVLIILDECWLETRFIAKRAPPGVQAAFRTIYTPLLSDRWMSSHTTTGPTQVIKNGKDRLTMKYISTGPMQGGGTGYDFDSLIWETKVGDQWRKRAIITQQQFEAGTDKRRWVAQLQSFDSKSGNAIIQVAEGDAPTNATHIHYNYSWREWNLQTNGQVRFIRLCNDTFEKY
jgi:hypothetical protein